MQSKIHLEPNERATTMIFHDRADAGKQLAQKLLYYKDQNPIVLALPRGGVVVGFEVARALAAPLDVLVARKLGAPFNPELGIGAIASGGVVVLDEYLVNSLRISKVQLTQIIEAETKELARRIKVFRGDKPKLQLKDRVVILVDDGLATGVTAKAAIASIRLMKPQKIVLAVPVAASDSIEDIKDQVDEFVCLHTPVNFNAVGLWYQNFEQLTDEEVVSILKKQT